MKASGSKRKRSRPATGPLEAALGLRFLDPEPFQQALVHKSFLNEQPLPGTSGEGRPARSYERLEYLGDSVIELSISTELFRSLPHFSEGELTKGRAELVCDESLARVARRLGLGDHLLLGKGEEANGGRQKDSILAAAFEAVVAAVHLDRGFKYANAFVLRAMSPELDSFLQQGSPQENPKSRLQEYVQSQGMPTPRYRIVTAKGPDHNPVFTVEALVEDQTIGEGQGKSRADAERSAAENALGKWSAPVASGQYTPAPGGPPE